MIKFINKLLNVNNQVYMLGHWCHVNIPKCNHDVILKKIDFANSDNNLSYKTNKTNKTNKIYITNKTKNSTRIRQ